MSILDNHVHTTFSGDAHSTMEEVIETAIENGMKHLTLTDHMEYGDFPFIDLDGYMKRASECKEEYADRIEVLRGIEVGYIKSRRKDLEALLDKHDYDFVLCSTHSIEGLEFYTDDANKLSQKELYTRYFESMLETVKTFKNYDVYAHLDYVIRYGNFENKVLNYGDYAHILDEILKTIADDGKGIEINTSGIRYGLGELHPNVDVVRRFKELGGKIVTVGSDAHRAEDLTKDFDLAYDALEEAGFEHIAYFKDRQVHFISIEDVRGK